MVVIEKERNRNSNVNSLLFLFFGGAKLVVWVIEKVKGHSKENLEIVFQVLFFLPNSKCPN